VRWAEPPCPAHMYAIICTCMYAYSELFANKCNVIFIGCNKTTSKYEKEVDIFLILALRYHKCLYKAATGRHKAQIHYADLRK
jgi:hypothetical protein